MLLYKKLLLMTFGTSLVVIVGAYHFCQLRTKFYPPSYCQG